MKNIKVLMICAVIIGMITLCSCGNPQNSDKEPKSSPAATEDQVQIDDPAATPAHSEGLAPLVVTPTPTPSPSPTYNAEQEKDPLPYQNEKKEYTPPNLTLSYFGIPENTQYAYPASEYSTGGFVQMPFADHYRIMNIINVLAEQHRAYGSKGEQLAADKIAAEMVLLGYEVNMQGLDSFNTGFTRPATVNNLFFEGNELKLKPVNGSQNGKILGDLLYYENGSLPSSIANKIIIISPNRTVFDIMMLFSSQKPAAVLLLGEDYPTNNFLNTNEIMCANLPNNKQTKQLIERLENGDKITAALNIDNGLYEYQSSNIEALLPATIENPQYSPILVVTAHYDSVFNAPGANDNASGVAAIIEVARLVARENRNVELRFVFFAGEEDNYIGSQYYMSTLSPETKSRILGAINVDMIASKNSIYPRISTASGASNATSDAIKHMAATYGRELPEIVKNHRSDHKVFANEGIDAIMISQPVQEGEYHTPKDVPGIISVHYIQEVCLWITSLINAII